MRKSWQTNFQYNVWKVLKNSVDLIVVLQTFAGLRPPPPWFAPVCNQVTPTPPLRADEFTPEFMNGHTTTQLNQDFLREPEQPMAWGPSQGYYGRS